MNNVKGILLLIGLMAAFALEDMFIKCNCSPPLYKGNYMRKCASGGQSLANAERGVGLSVPVQKIKFSINHLPVYVS